MGNGNLTSRSLHEERRHLISKSLVFLGFDLELSRSLEVLCEGTLDESRSCCLETGRQGHKPKHTLGSYKDKQVSSNELKFFVTGGF